MDSDAMLGRLGGQRLSRAEEKIKIPGMCVQYPGHQGGGALGDASTPGTPAASLSASAPGGTYSLVAVAGGGVGRGKGCRRRHRSGGGPPASREAHGTGRHSTAQRICARRAGRPTRRTSGRVGPIAEQQGASSRTARWR